MKTICQYITEIVPPHWDGGTIFERSEDRSQNEFRFEIRYISNDISQTEHIKHLIEQQGALFGTVLSAFSVYITTAATRAPNTKYYIELGVAFQINPIIDLNKITSDSVWSVISYTNLCVETHTVLLEYFVGDKYIPDGIEYFYLSSLLLTELYIAPFCEVEYVRTNIVTNDFFSTNDRYSLDRFIVASFK